MMYGPVVSYSDIPEDLILRGADFKLYLMIDGVKTEVPYETVDTDGDGIVDQMRWTVPQLSTEDFIIEADKTNLFSSHMGNLLFIFAKASAVSYKLEYEPIEINKPVNWTQTVTLGSSEKKIVIEIPDDAEITRVTADGQNVDLSTILIENSNYRVGSTLLIPIEMAGELVQNADAVNRIIINEAASAYTIEFETPAPYIIEESESTDDMYKMMVTVGDNSALGVYSFIRHFSFYTIYHQIQFEIRSS